MKFRLVNYIYIIIYYIYETFNYHRLKCLFCRFVDLTRGGGAVEPFHDSNVLFDLADG